MILLIIPAPSGPGWLLGAPVMSAAGGSPFWTWPATPCAGGLRGTRLGESLRAADRVYIYKPPGLDWDLEAVTAAVAGRCVILDSVTVLQTRLLQELRRGDVILLMGNAGFGGLQQRLLAVSGQRTGS